MTTETQTSAVPADLQDERLIASHGPAGWAKASMSKLRSGDLGSLPVIIGLIVIWAVFQILNSAFLSPDNLVNLTQQSAAVGTIALGIVLVLLLGEIDLSVGSMSGLAGAVLAVGFVNHGWSVPVAIVAALLCGVVVGLIYGALFTLYGVPSFVISLAGLLALLGMQLKVLGADGTINLPFDSPIVKFASQSFLPRPISYLVPLIVVALFLGNQMLTNSRRARAGLSVTPMWLVAAKSVGLALVLLIPLFILNRDRGLSWMFLTFLIMVAALDIVIRRTRWGRSVMAVGGNVEAARRAGIKVKRVYLTVFVACSTFAALGGVFAAARLASANQSSGGADVNLNAIASAVIGGTSLFGGRGSAYSALLGILVIQSISSGLSLLNMDTSYRYMITGAVLLLAVIIDSVSRRSRTASGRA